MALTTYQFQFGSFVFGAGTPFQVQNIDGLQTLPMMRTQDDNQGYNDGMFSGRDFLGGRDIVMDFIITAGNSNTAQTNFNLFRAALIPQQQGVTTLTYLLSPSDTQKTIGVRVRDRKINLDPEYTYGFIKAQVTFFAPDPRSYEASTINTLTPATPTGARTYNLTFNRQYIYGSSTPTTITNNGTWVAGPQIVLNGPFSSAILQNLTTNQTMTFSLSLNTGETLNIDCLNRAITKTSGGITTPARNYLQSGSSWIQLQTGSNSLVFTAYNNTGSTNAVVTSASAYI